MSSEKLRVLILGGRGYFGRRLAERLGRMENVEVLTGGRSQASCPTHHRLDAWRPGLAERLRSLQVDVVVAALGPFPGGPGSYRIAEAAIDAGVHYIDLADARAHVVGVTALDRRAREAGVMVVSGASSVPALSSAVVDHLARGLDRIDRIEHGISASELTPGAGAIRSALTYCGRPIRSAATEHTPTYGWQDGTWKSFRAPLGARWLLRCDVPDLDLFPTRYGTSAVDFRAGVPQLPHMAAMWSLSWLVRLGLVRSADRLAPRLHGIAQAFERIGSGRSGMYVVVEGMCADGAPKRREWQLIAEANHGPYVPVLAATALIRRLANGREMPRGARPCIGLVLLDQFRAELEGLKIWCGDL
jgi:hypothetical protein